MISRIRIAAEAGEGASQAVKAQLRLREMILAGQLPAGARIAELAIVERLGVSRTPIRAALMRLEQEGLLESLPGVGTPGTSRILALARTAGSTGRTSIAAFISFSARTAAGDAPIRR